MLTRVDTRYCLAQIAKAELSRIVSRWSFCVCVLLTYLLFNAPTNGTGAAVSGRPLLAGARAGGSSA
jgi:hypothetical protein